jgi:Glycosyl hydrolase-like 10
MKSISPIFLPVLVAALFASIFSDARSTSAQSAWSLTRPAGSFDRSELTNPDDAQKIRSGGSLSGAKDDWGITGWVEYDIDAPRSGWYEVTVHGNGREVQFLMDPESPSSSVTINGTGGQSLVADKVGNFWLASGRHRLRLQRYFWTGLPRIESITVTAAPASLAKSMRAALPDSPGIYRARECPPMKVFFGGRDFPTVLNSWVKDAAGKVRRTESVPVPRTPGLLERTFVLPCDEAGVFTVEFGENGSSVPWADVRPLVYEVVDTSRVRSQGNVGQPGSRESISRLTKTLVEEIDCRTVSPDYFSGGETRVVSTAAGTYRESGDTGFTRYQRTPTDSLRKLLPQTSWFAYRLRSIVAQKPYLVEVDYPDDRLRTFAIALRESAPLSYPVAGGVDSGGEFSLSNKMLTESLLYWPRAEGTRVTFLNAHDGRRAAVSRIRVYRVDGALPPLTQESSGRQFLNWYEEGSNFLSMYGAPNDGQAAGALATERWAEAVRYSGGTVLAPTVAIYSFALYPSRFNLAFSNPNVDYLRRILLAAEKNGLKVLPELHPRADELAWSGRSSAEPKSNLLISKDGKTSGGLPPLYNPLHPANQEWYVRMIGELADRYRDSPALMGVNLRLMQWANPALNNFHSLDWGYDDYTIELFKKETGSAVPLGDVKDTSRFANRYAWLMANARTLWIDWRCRKIAGLYTRISDRVRKARPDLKVYSSIFRWEPVHTPLDALRGAGIDPAMLREIAGIELINAMHAYGRKEADALATYSARDALLDPRNLDLLSGAGRQGRFLTGANYIEITEAIAPPESLGFPKDTKLTWTSATANPAGRHHLERFALELAETDATLLGDGGNAYSLGQPALRDFLAEYLRLPAEPFSPRQDARDPVAVWERSTPDSLMFYAVNRERFPVSVEVDLSAGAKVSRLSDNSPIVLNGGRLRFVLEPYQLVAFRADSGVRIIAIALSVSPEDRDRVASQIRWFENLAREQGGRWFRILSEEQKALLDETAKSASAALTRGHLWRARAILEDHRLLAIYRQLNAFPPHFLDDPEGTRE